METKEATKKVPLVKRSTSYKLIIPPEVERIIRFLCEKVWNTEWSGVLFYTPSGSFEDGSLEIHCVDIFPMDIGSATYTEFNMSPDVISYMAQNPELLDCKMGLIHSHNNMSTFFSGTDVNTLSEEGNERNHFVSLIVNNAGKYSAAITRKIKYHSVRDLSYEGFNGIVSIDGKEETDGEEIEYFNLDIVFEEEPDTHIQNIADRLTEIKKSKPAVAPNISPYGGYNFDSNKPTKFPTTTNIYKPTEPKYPTLFDDDDYNFTPSYKPLAVQKKEKKEEIWVPGQSLVPDEIVEKSVIQLITGSVTITALDKDAKEKILKAMTSRFENRFGKGDAGMKLFEYWATDAVEFILWYSAEDDVDECEFAGELAEKLTDALKKLPQNKFIDKYIDILVGYANKF